MSQPVKSRAQIEQELLWTRCMLTDYETMADELPFPLAWLSTMGQNDCRLEIERIEKELREL